MKKRWMYGSLVALVVVLAGLVAASRRGAAPAATTTVVATRGELVVWSEYDGVLEARRVETIMSAFNGSAAIIELAPEGFAVKKGDMVVRLDGSQVETDLLRLEHDAAMAESDLTALQNAEIPMQQCELAAQVTEARLNYESEKRYLEDCRELRQQDLVSEQEVKQQDMKVENLHAKLDQIETQRKLTETYLHPSKLARARAAADSAQRQVELLRQQVDNCVIRAPCDGMVVYIPLHVSGEYRTARVGDSVYRNQPFMSIPDMRDLIVHCYVPESDLGRVQAGSLVGVTPLAYPEFNLEGVVESVNAMAQTRSGYPQWQKYFHVVIGLRQQDERLRTGISVSARIRSYQKADAVQIPRVAVVWQDGRPSCQLVTSRGVELRTIKLGHGNETHFEVLAGLEPGDRLKLP